MKANRTRAKKGGPIRALRVDLLVRDGTSLGLSLLMKDVFAVANRVAQRELYRVGFVSARGLRRVNLGGIAIECGRPRGRGDFLVLPPFSEFSALPRGEGAGAEAAYIRKAKDRGIVLVSACLGSFFLASAGVLNGREATTHWAWEEVARSSFPKVKWDSKQMICDQGDVITAGGYLGAVDLVLHLISKTASRELAHRVGQILLADSVRQKQSIYAQSLIQPGSEDARVARLERWIEDRLAEPLAVSEMASFLGMSLRSFHRFFTKAYGTNPKKLIQLKRIERVQKLLRDSSMSVESAIEAVGVSDAASFRKLFRRELGLTPAEFRRRLHFGSGGRIE